MIKDLTGQKFGRLTVLEFADMDKNSKSLWKCQCDCEYENILIVKSKYLIQGFRKSCGCLLNPGPLEKFFIDLKHIEDLKTRIQNTCNVNENGCWIWNGYLCEPKKLYGLTTSNLDGKKKKILAHRLSYRLWKGEIANGLYVLHDCDIPLCCNPDHLHLGTAQDNTNEMKERGRENKVKGEKNHKSKLSKQQVLRIRALSDDGKTNLEISKLFNITSSNISMIINKKTWRQV